jgi:hypothetical protein
MLPRTRSTLVLCGALVAFGLPACKSNEKTAANKAAAGAAGTSAPPTAAAPALPVRRPPPHEIQLNVDDAELVTPEDFEEGAEQAITEKTWQAELNRLAKEIGEEPPGAAGAPAAPAKP